MEIDFVHQLVSLMLSCPDELRLETMAVEVQEQQVTLEGLLSKRALSVPAVTVARVRIHSRYRRTLADLLWAEIRVCLHLQVRKCFCTNPACTQRTFSERLLTNVAPWRGVPGVWPSNSVRLA